MAADVFGILYEHAETISIIVFYALVAAFFIYNRKNIQVQYKVFFLYHTKRFIKVIRAIANKFRSFWKVFGYIGVPVGFIGMAGIFIFLLWKLIELFTYFYSVLVRDYCYFSCFDCA